MVWTNATWRVSWSYITFKCLRKHHYGLESIQVSLNSLAKVVLDDRIALEFFFEGQERVCVIAKTSSYTRNKWEAQYRGLKRKCLV